MADSLLPSIPEDNDEAATTGGCTRFQEFWPAVTPIMGPGAIATGLFGFPLA